MFSIWVIFNLSLKIMKLDKKFQYFFIWCFFFIDNLCGHNEN